MLLQYILWDDWPIFMISASNQQLQQELKYTLLKPDCHSCWISKMQSDTLEERYAIKLCFKLGKNATETYGMLQTAFGASCMNRAWVFEWHKRFKEAGSLRGCHYETIEMKEAVTKVIDTRSHKRTPMGPCRSCWNRTSSALQPEEITSKGTRISCMCYQ